MNNRKYTSQRHRSEPVFAGLAKVCSKFIFLFFAAFLLQISFFTNLQAQPNTTESLELRVVTLEQQFDAQVLNVLANYFDSRKFFVDINIDAEFVNETYRTTENQITRGGQSQQSSEVMMPGLPFLPEENIQPRQIQNNNNGETTQTIINEHSYQRLQILGLTVNIYADSSFTPQEIEFMRLIGGIAAKINESRGDVVNVTQINMPDFGIDELPPARVEDQSAGEETLLGSIKDYVPGFVLLMLLGLTLLIGRLTHTPSNNQSKNKYTPRVKRDELKEEEFSSDLEQNYQLPEQEKKSTTPQKSAVDNEYKFITDQFFNHSKDVALLFEFWMNEDFEAGTQRSAKVIHTIDKHLLKALKGDLASEYYQAIQSELQRMEPMTRTEKKEIAKGFISALKNGVDSNTQKAKHQQLGLFQFLDHLKVHHIAQLIYGEDRRTSALLIDYLPDEKAARVLKRLGKDQTTDVMLGMAELQRLSYNDHKAISSRLFSKAMDILEVERELQQGTQNILRVLEQLPLEDQGKYIKQLKATGSPVADIVSKRFITIDQIPRLKDRFLKMAIDPISTEILVDALLDVDQRIVDKILGVRPKREQRLIRMELHQMDRQTSSRSKRAKQVVMNAIRKAARQY